jgi:hypothetical protein
VTPGDVEAPVVRELPAAGIEFVMVLLAVLVKESPPDYVFLRTRPFQTRGKTHPQQTRVDNGYWWEELRGASVLALDRSRVGLDLRRIELCSSALDVSLSFVRGGVVEVKGGGIPSVVAKISSFRLR